MLQLNIHMITKTTLKCASATLLFKTWGNFLNIYIQDVVTLQNSRCHTDATRIQQFH